MRSTRVVHIEGKCDDDEIYLLRKVISIDYDGDMRRSHCFTNTKNICGIGDWANSNIDATGRIAISNASIQDIYNDLVMILRIVKSLRVKVKVSESKHIDRVYGILTTYENNDGYVKVAWDSRYGDDETIPKPRNSKLAESLYKAMPSLSDQRITMCGREW